MSSKALNPSALGADLQIAFNEGRQVGSRSQDYLQLIQVETTSSDSKRIIFYGDKGRLRRFRDERQGQSFTEYKFQLTLDKWEYTTTVPSEVLDDDQTGGTLRRMITDFGAQVESSKEMETWEYLHKGVSLLGFDKAPLFSTAHRYVNSAGATNSLVAAQSNVNFGGSALDATTLQADQAYFANIVSDKNKVLGMRLSHVAVYQGSQNAKAARELANSTFTVEASSNKGQMTTNVFNGQFGIIEFNYGFGASEWLSLDLNEPGMKPLIVLTHTVSAGWNNLEYSQLLTDSDTGFWRDHFAFGIKGRFDWNVGDWRTAYLHGSTSWSPTVSDNESQKLIDPNA